MEEILKALAPWPLAQGIVLGLLVAGGGIWAMSRGWQDSKKAGPDVDDQRARWEFQRAMGHLDDNSFEIIELLKRQNDLSERILAAMNRLGDNMFNIRQ